MGKTFDFSGKVVFVAGGSSGINLGIAEEFAAAGAKVTIASRSQSKVDAALARLSSYEVEVAGYSADVRDYSAIAEVLASIHERFGDIDVLVSGAAGNFVAPVLGMSANGFKTVVDIDLLGTFNVLRAAHQYLRKPGSSVINISAPQGSQPRAFQAHVCAAKAGVDMLTRVLAIEWAGDGIRVNAIVPGPIAGTEGMVRLAPTPEAQKEVTSSIPLGRYGTKQEIANVALFLSSAFASYITGAIIPVDGGRSLLGASGITNTMRTAYERSPS